MCEGLRPTIRLIDFEFAISRSATDFATKNGLVKIDEPAQGILILVRFQSTNEPLASAIPSVKFVERR